MALHISTDAQKCMPHAFLSPSDLLLLCTDKGVQVSQDKVATAAPLRGQRAHEGGMANKVYMEPSQMLPVSYN